MDARHPESEAPAPGAVPREAGGISARVAQYCDHTVLDPDRTIDRLLERETAETLPAPPCEASERITMPPGQDAIDEPGHVHLLARIEKGLDTRFEAIREFLAEQLDAMTGALRAVAAEAARANHSLSRLQVLEADVEAIKARCPHCSIAPPEGNVVSVPPGD